MEEVSARTGELCTQCGTPLEPAAVTPTGEPDTNEIVLRCANGHEIRVTRHDHPEEESTTVEP